MDFGEWWRTKSGWGGEILAEGQLARDAWNAAIDEAVKVADIRDYEGEPLNPQLVEQIEVLKTNHP